MCKKNAHLLNEIREKKKKPFKGKCMWQWIACEVPEVNIPFRTYCITGHKDLHNVYFWRGLGTLGLSFVKTPVEFDPFVQTVPNFYPVY